MNVFSSLLKGMNAFPLFDKEGLGEILTLSLAVFLAGINNHVAAQKFFSK
jgi:hypothetical protein